MANDSESSSELENVLANKRSITEEDMLIEKAYDLAVSYGKKSGTRKLYEFNDGKFKVTFAVSKVEFMYFPTIQIEYDGKVVFGAAEQRIRDPATSLYRVSAKTSGAKPSKSWILSKFDLADWENQFNELYTAKTSKTAPPALPEVLASDVLFVSVG